MSNEIAYDDFIDPNQLKKFRLRIETEDPVYSGLKKIKIRGKELNDLPRELFHVLELQVLDLSPERESCINYRLLEMPPDIKYLQGLCVLMLDTNELDRIPPEVCLLSGLQRLSLSNNNIRSLPENIGSLTKLQSLHVANNRLVHFPKFLDVGSNQLESLPSDISKLRHLETLVVVFNRIRDLPEGICELTNLHMLWIAYNRITRLPRHFGRLLNLDWGFRHTSSMIIDGNPMIHPPVEICRLGVNAIASYFASSPATTDRKH